MFYRIKSIVFNYWYFLIMRNALWQYADFVLLDGVL